MDFLPEDFFKFLDSDCNRCEFIENWLNAHGVASNRITIEGKNHILVQFGSHAYNPRFRIKTVIAHHDRVGGPGANDNSAACWILMNWAVMLNNYPEFHNVRIFFTDGEELGWNTGVTEQGAFGIASTFQRLGIKNDDVYVFDACGRGEIPVLSKLNLGTKVPASFLKKAGDLFSRTQELLKVSSPGRWMTLPVPYSDNASFLACGIPAVAITMLPADEASLYARLLLKDKSLEESVLNRESSKERRMKENIPDYSYKEHLPLTWRLFHTPKDDAGSLTPVSFSVMENILKVLTGAKTPV